MGICEGRVVIVTGAGRGIGREHALELARQGARVVVNDLGGSTGGEGRDGGPAGEVAAEIRRLGGEAIPNGADIAERSDPAARGRGPALGKAGDPRAAVRRQVAAVLANQALDLSQLRQLAEADEAAPPAGQSGFAPLSPSPGPSITGTAQDGQTLTADRDCDIDRDRGSADCTFAFPDRLAA